MSDPKPPLEDTFALPITNAEALLLVQQMVRQLFPGDPLFDRRTARVAEIVAALNRALLPGVAV